jgi:putative PIN family toxin of toxin-antitoxin system
MKKANVRIIIDVNIWISCVIGQSPLLEKVSLILLQQPIELIVCHQLIKELKVSLQKPKLQKYLNQEMANEIAAIPADTILQ